MKIGILTNPMSEVNNAVKACQSLGVEYEIVDVFSADWIKNVKNSDADGFYCSSLCLTQELKTIQDERYFFISNVMHRPIYPDFMGLYIHESKRNMAAWLEINGYPHADTKVFTSKKEALTYLDNCQYPVVVKANLGSAASKVLIVSNKRKAKRIAKKCFPVWKLPLHLGYAYNIQYKHKMIPFLKDVHNRQKDYFLVQEFVKDVKWEWRILKIGNSYFGHQKLYKGNFASGSGLVGWVAPPKELLFMVKELCEKGGFLCMDVDIFETKDGHYYINELQSFFGSYLNYQMSIDGHHGRYVFKDGDFVFEEGDFNVFGSTKLKIEHLVELLSQNKTNL
jgi:glutathione synthase/RimK-type ligase-like ATP-grasp enzyme